ncbi:hypothetical protein [Kitasatospora sp. NPDC101183]|uniref:hypothetical protein n=1 Tax=Kitasatospora sp. NPDC101183 TaxID=3364100 RepID=UPI0037FC6413
MTRREPLAPTDPRLRAYTEPQITTLLGELHRRGHQFGILWGSAAVKEKTLDGHLLIDFGNASVSTLINLLHLLRETERNEAWTP